MAKVVSTMSTADHDDQEFLNQYFDPYIGVNISHYQVPILRTIQGDFGSGSCSTTNIGPSANIPMTNTGPSTNISMANETYGPEGFDDDELNWEDNPNDDVPTHETCWKNILKYVPMLIYPPRTH